MFGQPWGWDVSQPDRCSTYQTSAVAPADQRLIAALTTIQHGESVRRFRFQKDAVKSSLEGQAFVKLLDDFHSGTCIASFTDLSSEAVHAAEQPSFHERHGVCQSQRDTKTLFHDSSGDDSKLEKLIDKLNDKLWYAYYILLW